MGDADINLEEQIRGVEEQIRFVEEQIRSVEQKIERVEERIETSSDHQERARLQYKEAQLRDEKKQLRGKEAQGLEGGMQIGLEIGKPFKSDHPLSQFVACLQDRHLQEYIINAKSNSVIELPKGIVWLGDKENFSNQLFMRPCYFDLLEAKEEYFKLKSRLSAVVYTGTSGIGKSHLCAFVVARKLIAGTVVFFESTETKLVYRLHLAGGVYSVYWFKSSEVLDSLSPNENAVYIVDGGFAGFPGARVETQIFASPSRALYRPKRKVWPHYLYLHVPLFDLEELQSMRSAVSAFQKVSKEDVDEWFMVAGGVARTVLKSASLGHHLQDVKAEVEIQRLKAVYGM